MDMKEMEKTFLAILSEEQNHRRAPDEFLIYCFSLSKEIHVYNHDLHDEHLHHP